ncbi:MAG TPA: hypothetical protein VK961_16215 [Chthoniobacter sp.]|nr:hypothetical protein [Chthoniobacter sp.]
MPRIKPPSRGFAPFVLLTVLLAGRWLAFAEDANPTAFDKSRYESLRTKSPFAVATAVVAPTPQASFAANWFITGVARIGDNNFVTIKSRDLATQFSLYGDEPFNGVTLASVNWSDTIGKSTVILRKGTETARLEFNEAQLRATASTAAAASTAPAGGKPPDTNGVAPAPHPLGVNMAAANNTPNAPNGATAVPRRRVLPIPVPR